MFGWNWPSGSGVEDENVKRRTDDGQQAIRIAYLSFQLRWAYKQNSTHNWKKKCPKDGLFCKSIFFVMLHFNPVYLLLKHVAPKNPALQPVLSHSAVTGLQRLFLQLPQVLAQSSPKFPATQSCNREEDAFKVKKSHLFVIYSIIWMSLSKTREQWAYSRWDISRLKL